MENILVQPAPAAPQPAEPVVRSLPAIASGAGTSVPEWRGGLPLLATPRVSLRELRPEDAPALLSALTADEVTKFMSPPPSTLEGFQRFIAWAARERDKGNYICFGVVPAGLAEPVGLIQLRALEPGFTVAEWGFALGREFWGSGLFMEGAKLALDFAFETVGVHRLEARATTVNGRGNGALRKLGAVPEGVLPQSFQRGDTVYDQVLWSILADDWRELRVTRSRFIH